MLRRLVLVGVLGMEGGVGVVVGLVVCGWVEGGRLAFGMIS